MTKAIINKILTFSAVDGPGNRCAIFFQGCNFNCLYCHNPETIRLCINCGICVAACPSGALFLNSRKTISYNSKVCIECDQCLKACPNYSTPKATTMTLAEVMTEIIKVKPFISGITASGGECSLQSEFLTDLFTEVQKHNLTTFIDSNGYKPYELLPKLMSVCNAVILDVKAFDNNDHLRLTGKDNNNVLANLEFLARTGKLYEVRTVIVPEILNNAHTVKHVSQLLAKLAPNVRYKLIKFRNHGVRGCLSHTQSPSDEYIANLAKIAHDCGITNTILV